MKPDWGIKWFYIRERMGYSDLVTMRYRNRGGAWVVKDFPHRLADGFGMILSILRENGVQLPALSRAMSAPPAWMSPLLLLKAFFIHPRIRKNPWKLFRFQRPGSPADHVATMVWTREETADFEKHARDNELTPSLLLLSQITEWTQKNLLVPAFPRATWMCPVDLRGAFAGASWEKLFVSFAPIVFELPLDELRVREGYERFRRFLKNGNYWCFWELYLIGRFIGEKSMELLARGSEHKNFWTGTFSDLGRWNQKELWNAGVEDWEWVMSPPGSPNYPIGVSTIEWCGRRITTVKLHPSITGDEAPKAMALRMLRELGYLKAENP